MKLWIKPTHIRNFKEVRMPLTELTPTMAIYILEPLTLISYPEHDPDLPPNLITFYVCFSRDE